VDNDSAKVTSSGKSFHVRGPTTGKSRLVGDGCQLNRRHWQTVGASRTERSAARQLGDIVEWTKVLRCESVQDFVDENGNLVLDSVRHAQPVEADKRFGDVVASVLDVFTCNYENFWQIFTDPSSRVCHVADGEDFVILTCIFLIESLDRQTNRLTPLP